MSVFTTKDLYNSRNNMLLREIFSEFNPSAMLTYSKIGKDGKINLFNLYMAHSVDDPSEVTFAEEVFGDLYFWQCLSEAAWFKPHVEEWRHLAAIKRKQAAFKSILKEVKTNGRSAFSAAKYLIEEPWKFGSAVERKKVRKQISDSAEAALSDSTVQSDLNRLKAEGLIQ